MKLVDSILKKSHVVEVDDGIVKIPVDEYENLLADIETLGKELDNLDNEKKMLFKEYEEKVKNKERECIRLGKYIEAYKRIILKKWPEIYDEVEKYCVIDQLIGRSKRKSIDYSIHC